MPVSVRSKNVETRFLQTCIVALYIIFHFLGGYFLSSLFRFLRSLFHTFSFLTPPPKSSVVLLSNSDSSLPWPCPRNSMFVWTVFTKWLPHISVSSNVTPWPTATVRQEALTIAINESVQSLLFLLKPPRMYVYVNWTVASVTVYAA